MQKIGGSIGIILLCAVLLLYSNCIALQGVTSPLEEEFNQSFSIEGYEEAEEAVAYFLCQIQERNLDSALRVCAVGDIAEYFSMTSYLNYMEEFPGTELIPPSDGENTAYIEISRARLAYDYAVMFEKICDGLLCDDNMEIMDIYVDEPVNPDGMYYQTRDRISEILGCRNVTEVSAFVKTGDQVNQMKFSLARYRKYWKILLFNTLDAYGSQEPYIRVADGKMIEGIPSSVLESVKKDILPLNYYIVEGRKADNPEELLADFFVYLQRGDTLSAMSYFDIGEADKNEVVTVHQLEKQNLVARALQIFYYRILLCDSYEFEWAGRHFSDTPEHIPKLLDTSNMIFTDMAGIQLVEDTGNRAVYQIGYMYSRQYFISTLVLINDGGWKIEYME